MTTLAEQLDEAEKIMDAMKADLDNVYRDFTRQDELIVQLTDENRRLKSEHQDRIVLMGTDAETIETLENENERLEGENAVLKRLADELTAELSYFKTALDKCTERRESAKQAAFENGRDVGERTGPGIEW